MNFSADVHQWDYNTIYMLVTQCDAEPGFYDFKELLHPTRGTEQSKKDHNDSIRKTVCSMANADGGYLIFGVKDAKKHSNLTVEQRIVGVPKSSEYLKEFGNKIASIQRNVPCIYPDKLITIPGKDTDGIFVVRIPLSPLRPHMLEGTFYIRISTGSTEKMNWHEVRDQMLYTEGRLQKVRLLRLKIAQIKMLREMQLGGVSLHDWERELAQRLQYETSEFEAFIADICDLIPSQTHLLENLLDLSRTAIILNTLRNGNIQFTANNRENALAQESNLLGSLCEKCERQLEEMFGALTIEKS
ncbi:MAG: ATP-binding protein [Ktedonobacteraceae bacterium]|nr:ATP-binding protein [Ktedonobacteraceae bacterium]